VNPGIFTESGTKICVLAIKILTWRFKHENIKDSIPGRGNSFEPNPSANLVSVEREKVVMDISRKILRFGKLQNFSAAFLFQ